MPSRIHAWTYLPLAGSAEPRWALRIPMFSIVGHAYRFYRWSAGDSWKRARR